MTNAQIGFRNLEESKRHNQEQEQIQREQVAQSRYATDVNAETSRYVANTSAAASRYAAEQKASSSIAGAEISAAQRDRVLDFDKETQAFKNSISSAELLMKQATTDKQLEKIANDMYVDLEKLRQNAQQLGIDQAVADADIALKQAQKWQAYSNTGKNVSGELREWLALVKKRFAITEYLKGW